MAKLNRTCGICRKKYSYCPSCAADEKKPTWMAIFCSENCRELYNVITNYKSNIISKEDAFIKVNSLDLHCTNELPENFKLLLDEIISTEIKEKDEEIVEELTMENLDVKQIDVENIITENEEVIQEEKSIKPKKRNYNKNKIKEQFD